MCNYKGVQKSDHMIFEQPLTTNTILSIQFKIFHTKNQIRYN